MFNETNDNPYVAVVAKKHRNLKKKMDRILKIETQIQAGKPLDEEQKIMYTTKSSVEKSLNDLKAILTAFEEVAKEEKVKEVPLEMKKEASQEVLDGTEEMKGDPAEVEVAVAPTTIPTVMDSKPIAIIEEELLQVPIDTTTAATNTSTESADTILSILKALHVFHRYNLVVGRHLPEPVLCFLHTLLGLPGPEPLNPMLPPQEVVLTTAMDVLQRYVHDGVMLSMIDRLHSEMLLAPPCLLPPFLGFPFSPVPPIPHSGISSNELHSVIEEHTTDNTGMVYGSSNTTSLSHANDIAATTAQFLQELSTDSTAVDSATTITTPATATMHSTTTEQDLNTIPVTTEADTSTTTAIADPTATSTTIVDEAEKTTKRTRTRRSRNNKKDNKEITNSENTASELPVDVKLVPKNSTVVVGVEKDEISFFPTASIPTTTAATTNIDITEMETATTTAPISATTATVGIENNRRKRRSANKKATAERETAATAVNEDDATAIASDSSNTTTPATTGSNSIPIIPVRGVASALAYINSLQAQTTPGTTEPINPTTSTVLPSDGDVKEKTLEKKESNQSHQKGKKTKQQLPYATATTSTATNEVVSSVEQGSAEPIGMVAEHSAEPSSSATTTTTTTTTTSATASTAEYLRRMRGSRGRGGRNRPTTTNTVTEHSNTTLHTATTNSTITPPPTSTNTTIKPNPQPSETKKPSKVSNNNTLKPNYKPREEAYKPRSTTKKPNLSVTEK